MGTSLSEVGTIDDSGASVSKSDGATGPIPRPVLDGRDRVPLRRPRSSKARNLREILLRIGETKRALGPVFSLFAGNGRRLARRWSSPWPSGTDASVQRHVTAPAISRRRRDGGAHGRDPAQGDARRGAHRAGADVPPVRAERLRLCVLLERRRYARSGTPVTAQRRPAKRAPQVARRATISASR